MATTIKIINQSENPLPEYETGGASGMDLRANLLAKIRIEPLERRLVPTGIFVEIPEGYEIQIRPRSGMAFKYGLTCLNTPGTIDSDYRGEVKVLMINLDKEPQFIAHGDRIAQMVFQKIEKITWEPSQELNDTRRGGGGFGHTGTT